MKQILLLCAAIILSTSVHVWSAEAVKCVLAFQIENSVTEYVPPENNDAIMNAKKEHPDLGGTVYIYLSNKSNAPVSVKGISWDGVDIKTRMGAPDYGVIWWKCSPSVISLNSEAEISINLRESIKEDKTVTIDLGEAGKLDCTVKAKHTGPILSTVSFTPDLRTAYLYVDTAGKKLPSGMFINGKSAGRSAKVLGVDQKSGLALVKISPSNGFRQGERYLFRVGSEKFGCAGSIRAFGDLARFGTYGFANPGGFSAAGFDVYASFGALDTKSLTDHGAVGMKAAMIIGREPPSTAIAGNPNIYAYLAMDEPDVHDYSNESRPMHKRIGSNAMSLVEWGEKCEKADILTPTKTTIDLTFAPQNYFAYAKVADIANPDCYTVTIGWPLTAFRDKVTIIKRAAAPQPFTMTYQGCWEEWINPVDTWMGPAQIAERKSETMVNRKMRRGYGRAPSPEEARIPMLYGVGGGARGLFCYSASTEAFGTMMFHSVEALPEVWQEVTKTTRELRTVAPLVQISHPTDICKTNRTALWVRTLVCGEDAALVVAVNEACKSLQSAFIPMPVKNTAFSFPDLPWLAPKRVYKLGDGVLDEVNAQRSETGIGWNEDTINDGEVYLVCRDSKVADKLLKEYKLKSKYITEQGLKTPAESHLNGRRISPQD